MTAKEKEKIIESHLVTRCKEKDIFIVKMVGRKGIPDRLLIKNGKHVFIETKRPNEKARDLQEEIMRRLRNHGAICYVADTKELIDEIIEKEFS